MRKIRKAAVLVAALGSVGFLGAGAAHAGGGDGFDIEQSSICRSHDANVDVLGNVGIGNGLLGNAVNGEGNPGAQLTELGSEMGCNNTIG
ncbi:Putative secreted protein OS=Streptomyces glaucescens OX=1907 GN=SGLAU_12445 PE=4 SV=1 [Streptomyces glaucescens]